MEDNSPTRAYVLAAVYLLPQDGARDGKVIQCVESHGGKLYDVETTEKCIEIWFEMASPEWHSSASESLRAMNEHVVDWGCSDA